MTTKLSNFRKQIDKIDELIVILLAKRMKIVRKIGRVKKKNSLPALDKTRWQKVVKSKKGFMKKIWEIIHKESLKVEEKI